MTIAWNCIQGIVPISSNSLYIVWTAILCGSPWVPLSVTLPFFFFRMAEILFGSILEYQSSWWKPDMARSACNLRRPGNTVIPHSPWAELQMRNLIIRGNCLWDFYQPLTTTRVADSRGYPYLTVPTSVTL